MQKLSRPERNAQTKARNQARRAKRREAAEERNSAWQALSPENQLAILARRPGQSARQRARIGVKAAA